jgi:hypothetical protein
VEDKPAARHLQEDHHSNEGGRFHNACLSACGASHASRITNVEGQCPNFGIWTFGLRHSFVIRISAFDIRSPPHGLTIADSGN